MNFAIAKTDRRKLESVYVGPAGNCAVVLCVESVANAQRRIVAEELVA